MVVIMDSLPKLKSFFGIELEVGVKIFSLVLPVLALVAAMFSDHLDAAVYSVWIFAGPILATLSAVAFGLAFLVAKDFSEEFALRWNKTRKLLIPAAVMSPILSLVSLIFFVMVLVKKTSAGISICPFAVFLLN